MTGPLAPQQRQLLDDKLAVLALLEAIARGDVEGVDAIAASAGEGISVAMWRLLRDALVELTPDSAMDWIGRKRAELLAEQA